MSEVPILEETERTTGRDALRKNIQAAIALAGAVRSTLGPKGLDKLLVDDEGRSMVTNDGITVLESAKVEHPIAHMLISASATQEQTFEMEQQHLFFSQLSGCRMLGIWLYKAFIQRPLLVDIESLNNFVETQCLNSVLKHRRNKFLQQQKPLWLESYILKCNQPLLNVL
jgi:hypothetical protein